VWARSIDSDYFYLAVDAVLESKSPLLALQFAGFLEWLHDHVESDVAYENYYALLSWALTQRIATSANFAALEAVLRILHSKGYYAERLTELTVSDRGADAWLALHRRVPSAGVALDEQFEKIILGER